MLLSLVSLVLLNSGCSSRLNVTTTPSSGNTGPSLITTTIPEGSYEKVTFTELYRVNNGNTGILVPNSSNMILVKDQMLWLVDSTGKTISMISKQVFPSSTNYYLVPQCANGKILFGYYISSEKKGMSVIWDSATQTEKVYPDMVCSCLNETGQLLFGRAIGIKKLALINVLTDTSTEFAFPDIGFPNRIWCRSFKFVTDDSILYSFDQYKEKVGYEKSEVGLLTLSLKSTKALYTLNYHADVTPFTKNQKVVALSLQPEKLREVIFTSPGKTSFISLDQSKIENYSGKMITFDVSSDGNTFIGSVDYEGKTVYCLYDKAANKIKVLQDASGAVCESWKSYARIGDNGQIILETKDATIVGKLN